MTVYYQQIEAPAPFSMGDYNKLTKPGLLFWVYLSALVSYVFSVDGFHIADAVNLFVGIYLTGASAHIFNQYLESENDAKMRRTQNRPFVLGKLSSGNGFFIGMGMLLFGYSWLFIGFNPLTAFLSLLCFLLYVFAYTPMKKISIWNTWIGAIPGALPAIIGGAAATGIIQAEAVYFFVLLVFWQIPHFLSLAWKCRDDYAKANFKMLSLVDKNGQATFWMILIHSVLLTMTCFTAYYFFSGLGVVFAVVTAILCVDLLYKSVRFYFRRSDKNAMKIFFNSLYFIPIIYGAFITDAFFI